MSCGNCSCNQGRDCPARYTLRGLIAMACMAAFCLACAVAIAFSDCAALPY